jgi:hypothetical protein
VLGSNEPFGLGSFSLVDDGARRDFIGRFVGGRGAAEAKGGHEKA